MHDRIVLAKFQVMKRSFFIIGAIVMLSSCVSTSRRVEIDKLQHDGSELQLVQNLNSHSSAKSGNRLVNQFFKTKTTFIFEEESKLNPRLSVGFQMPKIFRTEQLEPFIFFDLDNEEIRIDSLKRGNNQLTVRQFIIPENLWVSVANSQNIQFQLYVGKEEIDVKPDASETAAMKELFDRAIQIRNANIPAIPEGLKKW